MVNVHLSVSYLMSETFAFSDHEHKVKRKN